MLQIKQMEKQEQGENGTMQENIISKLPKNLQTRSLPNIHIIGQHSLSTEHKN
jgi:hypothetical protein